MPRPHTEKVTTPACTSPPSRCVPLPAACLAAIRAFQNTPHPLALSHPRMLPRTGAAHTCTHRPGEQLHLAAAAVPPYASAPPPHLHLGSDDIQKPIGQRQRKRQGKVLRGPVLAQPIIHLTRFSTAPGCFCSCLLQLRISPLALAHPASIRRIPFEHSHLLPANFIT